MATPIDPSVASPASLDAQRLGARRLDASLAKLTAATAVKPAPVEDNATLTRSNVLKAVRDAAPLRELGARLIDLRRLLADPRPSKGNAGIQGKIDEILAGVRKTAESLRGGSGAGPLSPVVPQQPNVADITPGITNIQVSSAGLQPGESVDVNVQITQSAQTASLMLSFGGANLDLDVGGNDPNARFSLEISGPLGEREFSFTSGTSLNDIAETFNSFSGALGLSAIVSGTAVRLDSLARNSNEFVSVRVIDEGDLSGTNTGIYRYEATDGNTADPQTLVGFEKAQGQTLTDLGQDLIAFINGVEARVTNDLNVAAMLGDLKVSFDLSISQAQWLDEFRAFRVVGSEAEGSLSRLLGQRDSGQGEALSTLVDEAIREVERAEREVLLSRNAEGLKLEQSDIPVIRDAQARLLDEARRLGLLAQPNPSTAYDALKP